MIAKLGMENALKVQCISIFGNHLPQSNLTT